MANTIDSILGNALDGIKKMVDVQTVIGDPITVGDITLLPVSKVSFGFAAGGTSFGKQTERDNFGGGAGGGVKVTPLAFLVINGTDVRVIFIDEHPDALDKLASYLPQTVDKISAIFQKEEKSE